MINVTAAQILAIAPHAVDPDVIAAAFTRAFEEWGIDTPRRAAHALGQCAHESWGFTRMRESFAYTADRLMKIFPRQFPTREIAEQYVGRPEWIANRAYANMLGNGPETSGDGSRFAGRGYPQLTGRANYRDAGLALGVDLEGDPDQAAAPQVSASILGWFWHRKSLNAYADRDDVESITRAICGAPRDVASRAAYTDKAKRALGV